MTIGTGSGMCAMPRRKSRNRENAWLTLAGVLVDLIVRRTMSV
jgi:hypothetical protein